MSVVVEDELLIGRNAEGAGRLAEDDEISRTHARVSLDSGGRCVIEDLGSTNGTFVNRRRISEPQELAVGDTLELGASVLVVRDLPAPPASPTTWREVPPDQPSQSSGTQVPGGQSAERVIVEPTVINAPIATPVPSSQEAPAESDASKVVPTAVPPPAEPQAPDTAPTPVPAPAASDARDRPAAPVATPPLRLEVDFEARELRIAPGHDAQPVRLVFIDGSWRPVTPS